MDGLPLAHCEVVVDERFDGAALQALLDHPGCETRRLYPDVPAKPVTLAVTSFTAMAHPMLKKPTIGANAFTTIKRWDVGAGKFAPYAGDEVRIDIALEAIAQ